jgi:acyl-CoA dehydrogenase
MATPVPFSEPPYLLGLPSPYYSPLHRRWQRSCRAFISHFLIPKSLEWETAEIVPDHVFQDFAEHNMLIPSLGAPMPTQILNDIGVKAVGPKKGQIGGDEAGPDGVVPLEEWDYICVSIYVAEVLYTLLLQFHLTALC